MQTYAAICSPVMSRGWKRGVKRVLTPEQGPTSTLRQMKAELALFSFDPATHPPVKVYLAAQAQPI